MKYHIQITTHIYGRDKILHWRIKPQSLLSRFIKLRLGNSFKKECGLVVDETIMISPIVGSKPPMDSPLILLLIGVGAGGLSPRGTAYF